MSEERRDGRARHAQGSLPVPAQALGVAVIGIALIVLGFVAGRVTGGGPSVDPVATAGSDDGAQAPSSPSSSSDHYIVQPTDVLLDLKILSKKNFGSAGSNIRYRVQLRVTEPARSQIAEGDMWEVTFEVRGDEDGPQLNTLRFYGDGSYDLVEDTASTATTDTALSIALLELEDLSGWSGD